MNKEEFRDVPGYEGYYQVGSLGTVISMPRKGSVQMIELKQAKSNKGYMYVTLSVNNLRKKIHVHQLVAMAFLGHTICGMEKVIDHRDFNKTNNNVSNLRIVSARENSSRVRRNKTSKYVGVHFNKLVSKWVASIRIEGKKKHLGYFSCETKARLRYESCLKLVNC
jgi:hypothetical protein